MISKEISEKLSYAIKRETNCQGGCTGTNKEHDLEELNIYLLDQEQRHWSGSDP